VINVRTARRILDNLEDRRGTAERSARQEGQTPAQRKALMLKRSRAQSQATRGLIQMNLPVYRVLYKEALRRQGVEV
jgi:hypothetical protein